MDTRYEHKLIMTAAENIAKMSPGTQISHQVLGTIVEADRNVQPHLYYSRMSKVRRVLIREYGVFLRTRTKIGYDICQYGEEIVLCQGHAERGMKMIRRAASDANYIRVDRIESAEKRSATILQAQKLANLAGLLLSGQRQPA